MSNSSVILGWLKPEDDGGSPVGNYSVKYTVKDSDKWTEISNGKKTKATINKLKSGVRYEFHVAAENEAGIGEAEIIGPIGIREITIPPEADLSLVKDVIDTREGCGVKFEIPFYGKPSPVVSWSKNRIPLKGRCVDFVDFTRRRELFDSQSDFK